MLNIVSQARLGARRTIVFYILQKGNLRNSCLNGHYVFQDISGIATCKEAHRVPNKIGT